MDWREGLSVSLKREYDGRLGGYFEPLWDKDMTIDQVDIWSLLQ
jgi:hypothetical protein